MSRYISKDDAVLAIAKHEMFEAEEYPYASQDIEDWKEVAEMMLADVPEVDVVPVVRCGECRHRYLEHDVWICRFGLMMPGPDGFCSYGEKVTE